MDFMLFFLGFSEYLFLGFVEYLFLGFWERTTIYNVRSGTKK